MPDFEARIQALVTKIRQEFDSVPYPGDEVIIPPDLMAPGYNWDDAIDAYRAYKGVKWQDVTPELAIDLRNNLSAFSPEGFRYYLPAWMIVMLTHYDKADTLIDNVIFGLAPRNKYPETHAEIYEIIDGLDDAKSRLVLEFITLFRELELKSRREIELPSFLDSSLEAFTFWSNRVLGNDKC